MRKLTSLFANNFDQATLHLFARTFSLKTYLRSCNSNLFSRRPFFVLSPTFSSLGSFVQFSTFRPRFRRIVGGYGKRAEGECRGKSTTKYQREERGKKKENGKNKERRKKDKAEGAKRSGRVFRDGCSSELAAKERRVVV